MSLEAMGVTFAFGGSFAMKVWGERLGVPTRNPWESSEPALGIHVRGDISRIGLQGTTETYYSRAGVVPLIYDQLGVQAKFPFVKGNTYAGRTGGKNNACIKKMARLASAYVTHVDFKQQG